MSEEQTEIKRPASKGPRKKKSVHGKAKPRSAAPAEPPAESVPMGMPPQEPSVLTPSPEKGIAEVDRQPEPAPPAPSRAPAYQPPSVHAADGGRPPRRDDRRPPDRPERHERNERPDRNDRADRPDRHDRRPDRDDRRDDRHQAQGPRRPPAGGREAEEGEEYSLQVIYDRSNRQFIATVLELPDVRVTGTHRDTVIRELEVKIDDKLLALREAGQPIPEPLGTKRYPETLQLRLSQGLYRKLDMLSRHERQDLDHLVAELISGAVERRFEQLGGGRPQAGQRQSSQQPHHQEEGGGGRRRGGGQPHQGGRGGRMSQRNYQNTMQSRESFMEYVRNLEKGGGWKKR